MKSARMWNNIWTCILYLVSAFILLLLLFLLLNILQAGHGFWNIDFITGTSSNRHAGGGIGAQLFNSFYLLLITLLISVPLGLGAGIYLAEYAKPGKSLEFIRLCIETMASLPSIVVGLFGLLVFVIITSWGYTLFAGALVLTILTLPNLTRICENSIINVSPRIKEASLGLGATKWQTIVKLIIPTATPQIITGIILSSGRIFGEAAALLFTAGLTTPELRTSASILSPVNPFNIFRPAETLSVHIWKLNSEGIVPDAQLIASRSAAILIVMVIIFNIGARTLSTILHNRFIGKKRKHR